MLAKFCSLPENYPAGKYVFHHFYGLARLKGLRHGRVLLLFEAHKQTLSLSRSNFRQTCRVLDLPHDPEKLLNLFRGRQVEYLDDPNLRLHCCEAFDSFFRDLNEGRYLHYTSQQMLLEITRRTYVRILSTNNTVRRSRLVAAHGRAKLADGLIVPLRTVIPPTANKEKYIRKLLYELFWKYFQQQQLYAAHLAQHPYAGTRTEK
jgi:hypothetical protein